MGFPEEKRLDTVSGFYSLCPFIAGTWPQDVANEGILGDSHLPHVNNGYMMTVGGTREMSNRAVSYGPEAFLAKDPMAWPGFATVEDLRGLPRCMVSVNECDALRDEGVNFYNRLNAAGVPAMCRTVLGAFHAPELFMAIVPDIALETAQSIVSFARQGAAGPGTTSSKL